MRTSWRNPHLRRGDKRPVYLRVGPGSERVGGWVEKHRQAVRCLLFSRYGEGLDANNRHHGAPSIVLSSSWTCELVWCKL